MFHVENEEVRQLLLKGNFGLERESLRVDSAGFLAMTPNPFEGEEHIVRDFSENQVEINTGLQTSPEAVVAELEEYDARVQRKLAAMPEREFLWPFSNPAFIRNERDIPVAQFYGDDAYKTTYREYLSDRYGRYKMAFSGIHLNYSFSDELLQKDFELSDFDDFRAYKEDVYLTLAKRCVVHGWLMMAITAASPMMDSSYVEKGKLGEDLYLGLASVRGSELGYWNFFAPLLDYSSASAYADSIQRYIDMGLIKYPSELYFPIRVKPRGAYGLEALRAGELSHIELRMIDLNPLYPAGINPDDVFFGQLMLVWLASTPAEEITDRDQVQAIQNFKNASHYDLKTCKILTPQGDVTSAVRAAFNIIDSMEEFYADACDEVKECIAFQRRKFEEPETRYAWQVRDLYSDGFVAKGLELAWERQESRL